MTQEELLKIIEKAAKSKATRLRLSYEQLTLLPPEIGQLSSLRVLELTGNHLTALPSEIGQLINLEALYLDWNGLTTLPSEIGRLKRLTDFQLRGNKIESLPIEMQQLNNLMFLDLRDNETLPIPPEIVAINHLGAIEQNQKKPMQIIKFYLESVKHAVNKGNLNEAKLLIVGQGGVGKTSLVNRLVDNTFNATENKTEGVNIVKWKIKIDNEIIQLNIWDFGGQEIMHATHQFFLTRRSLYILVVDARQEEKFSRTEYWLKLIQSFGGDSPIIIVINKTDQQSLDINRKYLKSKYPTIKDFFDISCKTRLNIDKLIDSTKHYINELPHVHDPFPKQWFSIKNILENMPQDYIEYNEYQKICEKEGVSEEDEQLTLISFLHDLGTILSFRNDELRPQLGDTGILNPKWVTEGIYKLLNSPILFHNKGILKFTQLSNLLDKKRYPQNKHRTIIELMEKFELCLDFPDDKSCFLIPELLSKDEPDINWDLKNSLAFEFHYDVLPNSIISRFIVRMQGSISQKTYWHTGVVLAYQDESKNNEKNSDINGILVKNKALVKADIEDKKIFIWISGNEKTRREFLAVIRHNLEAIHKTITKIQAVKKVPYKNVVIDYNHLLTLEKLKKETFVPEGLAEEINVAELLDGVENRTINTQSIQITIQNTVNDNSRKFENTGTAENSNFNLGNDSEQNTQIKKA